MRGYSHIGMIRNLEDYPVSSSALHHAPIVLAFTGDTVRPCGRGKMVAIEGVPVGSASVGPFMVVWGSDDSEVAAVISQGHARVVYIGADKPGKKTRAALSKLKRAGLVAFSAGPEVLGVGRIDCEGERAGTLDLLVDSEWVKHEPTPPKKSKQKAQEPAAEE